MLSFLGENRIEMELQLSVNINIYCLDPVTFLENIEEGEPCIPDQNDHTLIRVYFTNHIDNLWSICKRHRIKKQVLMSMNEDVDFENLAPGTMMILP